MSARNSGPGMTSTAALPVPTPRTEEHARLHFEAVAAPNDNGSHDALPEDKFWLRYLVDAEKYDRLLADGWKGDTDGILIFVSSM